MKPVNDPNWLGFPPGTVRLEKPEEGDVRKLSDGTFDVTVRFTRVMTPEERAAQVWNSWPDVPGPPSEFDAAMTARIAAAIRAAVAEERERCARVVEEWEELGLSMTDDGWLEYPSAYQIAARIRTLE